jgi:hypothetical protein
MQEPDDRLQEAMNPLCGFGGNQIVALGKNMYASILRLCKQHHNK